jgi:surface protein
MYTLGLGLTLNKIPTSKSSFGDPAFIISILSDGAGAFTIPTNSGTYNYDVEVVGGSTFTGNTGNFQVTGLTPSTAYDLRITGAFPQIYFNNTAVDRTRITAVKNWGSQVWSSMNNAFWGCTNLNGAAATDAPNLSSVTDMSQMFLSATSFNQDIGNWDVSNVTSMSQMFGGATSFNQDINSWNVGSVTTMFQMFISTNYNQNIGSWNVGSVMNFSGMFRSSASFNQNIGNWDVSSATNMSLMFRDASSFDGAIENWNVGSVSTIEQMFRGASSFDRNLGNWDVRSVTNATDFMRTVSISTVNYDGTLIGWAALSTPTAGLTISFGSSQYTNSGVALAARNTLTTTYTWNITDGGGI